MEQPQRYSQKLLHSTVPVDAQYLQSFAAIRSPLEAHTAGSAVHIGVDGATITGFDAKFVFPRGDDGASALMAQNPRIYISRVLAGKGIEVGAAYADPLYFDQCFIL